MTISEQVEAGRRERRVLTRVSRAAWRLEQAERERTWALVSARAEVISIRTLAAAIGVSPSRVHQLTEDRVGLPDDRGLEYPGMAVQHIFDLLGQMLSAKDSEVGQGGRARAWRR